MDQTEVRTTQSPPRLFQPTIRSHLAFTALSALVLLVMFSLLRLALLIYNRELIGATPASTFLEAFGNGVRFDLRVVVYAVAPLVLSLFAVRAMAARGLFRTWLTLFASITLFLGVLELDFYREFHQRLNSLVFQYMSEDPKTVMSMLWYGFPVVRYLLAWAFATWVLYRVFKAIDLVTRPSQRKPREDSVIARPSAAAPWYVRGVVLFLCVLVCVLAARGTLRQGPPLRWGDAFTTESMFANQLGLNGTLTLVKAAKERFSEDRANIWKATLDDKVALETTRQMLLTPNDKLVDADEAAVRREFTRRRRIPCRSATWWWSCWKASPATMSAPWARRATSRRISTSCRRKACCSPSSSPTAPIPTRACSPPWPASPTCRASNT